MISTRLFCTWTGAINGPFHVIHPLFLCIPSTKTSSRSSYYDQKLGDSKDIASKCANYSIKLLLEKQSFGGLQLLSSPMPLFRQDRHCRHRRGSLDISQNVLQQKCEGRSFWPIQFSSSNESLWFCGVFWLCCDILCIVLRWWSLRFCSFGDLCSAQFKILLGSGVSTATCDFTSFWPVSSANSHDNWSWLLRTSRDPLHFFVAVLPTLTSSHSFKTY